MPSQKQVRWAQLRVGIIVIFASVTLAVLIFLMTGTQGLFTRKIILKSYVDNAGGLRVGAPVRLQGVDIGNVIKIRVDPSHGLTPVEITMKISTKYIQGLRKDATSTLSTAGVLGETFVDIDSRASILPVVKDGDVLATKDTPQLEDVVRGTQSTLQNVDTLLQRVDRIIAYVESGKGTIGKVIYDPELFNRLNATLSELQNVVHQVSSGKGSIGKLINDDELYNKANDSVNKLSKLVDEIDQGKGTVGKLLKDPSLYDNANQTIAKANRLMDDVNAGRGALGKFAKDEEFARKLDTTMTRLASISEKIDSGQGTVGKFMNDPSLYNNTDQLLVETRGLIKAVKQDPKKYLTIHLKLF